MHEAKSFVEYKLMFSVYIVVFILIMQTDLTNSKFFDFWAVRPKN